MIRCARCNRFLTRESVHVEEERAGLRRMRAYGPRCAQVLGLVQPARKNAPADRKPAGVRRFRRRVDSAQADLFAVDLEYAQRVDRLLGSVSLEMPA